MTGKTKPRVDGCVCNECDVLLFREPEIVEHTGIEGDSIRKEMIDCPVCEERRPASPVHLVVTYKDTDSEE